MTSLILRKTLVNALSLGALLGFVSCKRDLSLERDRHFHRAQDYAEHQEYPEAMIELENATRLDPTFSEGFLTLGVVCRQLGHYDEAVRAFRRCLDLNPTQSQAATELGEVYLMGRDSRQARALAQEVLGRDENLLAGRILLAKSYLGENNFAAARKEFEKARQISPNDPAIYLAIGVAEIGLGNSGAAETNFRKALQLDPARAEAYQDLANVYMGQGHNSEAEKLLNEGVRRNPSNLQLHFALTDFYYRTGRNSEAEAVIESVEKSETEPARRLMELGDFWLAHSESARAIREYQASQTVRGSELVTKKLVSAYIAQGDAENAARWNERLLRSNDKDHEARMFAGAIAYMQGKNKEAATLLQPVVNEDSSSLFAHYYLGETLLAEGRLEAARTEFVSCLRLDDKFVHAYVKLAELDLQRDDVHGAAEYAKRVIALDPGLLDGYLLAADAALADMDREEAQKALTEAAQIAGQDYRLHERWAELYALEKHDVRAKRELEGALSSTSNPVEPLARLMRSYLRRNEVSKGTAIVEAVIATHGGNPATYELLAGLYLKQGKPSEAANACRNSLAIDANRVDAVLCFGEALDLQGNYDEAEQTYSRAFALQPEQVSVNVQVASFYCRRADFPRARQFYQQALKIDPESPVAQAGMARTMAETGQDLDLALSLAQQAKQQRPQSPDTLETLAWVYHKKGMNDLAIPMLKECTSKDRSNSLCQYDLGMLQVQNGKMQQGRHLLAAALRNGLGAPFAIMAKQTLASSLR